MGVGCSGLLTGLAAADEFSRSASVAVNGEQISTAIRMEEVGQI